MAGRRVVRDREEAAKLHDWHKRGAALDALAPKPQASLGDQFGALVQTAMSPGTALWNMIPGVKSSDEIASDAANAVRNWEGFAPEGSRLDRAEDWFYPKVAGGMEAVTGLPETVGNLAGSAAGWLLDPAQGSTSDQPDDSQGFTPEEIAYFEAAVDAGFFDPPAPAAGGGPPNTQLNTFTPAPGTYRSSSDGYKPPPIGRDEGRGPGGGGFQGSGFSAPAGGYVLPPNDAPITGPVGMWTQPGDGAQMPDPADEEAFEAIRAAITKEFGNADSIYNPKYDTERFPTITGGDGAPAGGGGSTVVEVDGAETPTSEDLMESMFTQMGVDAQAAYEASADFYETREDVLYQNILELEKLRKKGIVGAAEAARQALIELKNTRTERLRLDEIAATARLSELEGMRRTQETGVSDAIKARGAGMSSDFDTRMADAEAQLAALGITGANPELASAGALGSAMLGSQADSQQALVDRFRMANEQAAVDRGMALSGSYDQAGVDLADRLWSANTSNDAAEQQRLQALAEYVMSDKHSLEDKYANLNFANDQNYRGLVGAFDPETNERLNSMGGSLGASHYNRLIGNAREDELFQRDLAARIAEQDAANLRQDKLIADQRAHEADFRQAGWDRADQQAIDSAAARSSFFNMVDDYMGFGSGTSQGFSTAGLLPQVYNSLYGQSDTSNQMAVTMPNGQVLYVDPMEFLRYERDIGNDMLSGPQNLVPLNFNGQEIMVPLDSIQDMVSAEEYMAYAG